MTLQKFRLAYLLVVVLTVTTVYAIADFNQGTPLELSDSEMQELLGAKTPQSHYRWRCEIWADSANCTTACVNPSTMGVNEKPAGTTRVNGGIFFDKMYGCEFTGSTDHWCNVSNWGKSCSYQAYDDQQCLQNNNIGLAFIKGWLTCTPQD